MRRRFKACGVISGTSRDGIDVAIVEIGGRFPSNSIGIMHFETHPYPSWLRRQLQREIDDLRGEDLASLDFLLGRVFGGSVLRTLGHAGLKPSAIDVIGSHGQTLLHRPRGVRFGGHLVRSTLQVGSGAVIAQTTGITTVSDFRSADIAVGGEGAPLVPVFDYVVLRSAKASRVGLNIGGIANLTAVPRGAAIRDVLSFDTGPGNCMIDTAVRILTSGRRRYDKDGAMAQRGSVDTREMRAILRHPYFRRTPPKSTGWSEFGHGFTARVVSRMLARGLSRDDIVRTLTEATLESIARAVRDFVSPSMTPDEIVVTGGGAHNPVLISGLKARLSGATVDKGEAFGLPSDAKEACAFAFLAYLALKGIPGNIISQNHGLKPAVLGAVYPTHLHTC